MLEIFSAAGPEFAGTGEPCAPRRGLLPPEAQYRTLREWAGIAQAQFSYTYLLYG
jgi:hypothetical protein